MYEKPIVESILKTVEQMDAGVEATASTPLSVSSVDADSRTKLVAIANDAKSNPSLSKAANDLILAIEASKHA
jgi:hypothetical protein